MRAFLKQLETLSISKDETIKRYNEEYHLQTDGDNGRIDRSIVNRIRFLNQTGVLIKKNLIDIDLLFGLIGAGLEIDYPVLDIILRAHRIEHNMPYMYYDLNTIWLGYQNWKEERRFTN